ncbi:ribosome maturation factor RimM [Synechococcus sp. PCC 7336]|uniref:ribosome maturation factor RimM n=1 Tax=Synechococcus sp. PCC 7336 TaxID=195250 RepID=UPI00034A9C95|nr:ribosome maturation factor RimM [Synechococcus sp. PCC 7336]
MANEPATDRDRFLTVGKVKSAHGLRGLLKVRSFSDFPERFTQPGQRWLQRQGEPPTAVKLLEGTFQPGKKLYLVQFEEIGDRTTAESWIGATVLVPEGDRPPLGEDEYRVSDLIGVAVYEQSSGDYLGAIASIFPAGSDVLEIVDGDRRVLIPFVKAFVPIVDLASGRIEVTPPQGLLE